MALDPCVKDILCSLGAPALGAVNALIVSTESNLNALKSQLQVRGVTLGLQNAAINTLNSAAQSTIEGAASVTNLLPLASIQGCAPLGDFQGILSGSVEEASAAVDDLATDAIRAASIDDEVKARIAEIDIQIGFLNDVKSVIQECLRGG